MIKKPEPAIEPQPERVGRGPVSRATYEELCRQIRNMSLFEIIEAKGAYDRGLSFDQLTDKLKNRFFEIGCAAIVAMSAGAASK